MLSVPFQVRPIIIHGRFTQMDGLVFFTAFQYELRTRHYFSLWKMLEKISKSNPLHTEDPGSIPRHDAMVVLTCFVKCGYVYVLVLLCVGVLVIRVLVFIVFCIACTVFLYCFIYVYYLFCLY